MADHKIKFSEVPKGQRMQQFKDYYLLPLIIVVLIIYSLFSILKLTFFTPKPDANLLVATKSALPEGFTAQIERLYEEKGADYNGDDKKLIYVTDILFDELSLRKDPQLASSMQAKLMATIATAENIIQIVDEGMYEYLDVQGLIGTYSDLGKYDTESLPDEKVKIPLSSLSINDSGALEKTEDELYITIRPRTASQLTSDEAIKRYENQIALIFDLFN